MLAKRIIACLDVDSSPQGPVVVKGRKFRSLERVGRPSELAKRYCEEGADEIVLLDVGASKEGRAALEEAVRSVAKVCFVPLTVGGGTRNLGDARRLFLAGADKVSINTAALKRPGLIGEISRRYGRQAGVVAIDAVRRGRGRGEWFECMIRGGSEGTGIDALDWARRAEELGAGEILWTSVDADGTCKGYDLKPLALLLARVRVPVIASGGAGRLEDFWRAIMAGADAVLAAGVFHRGEISIPRVKNYLKKKGVVMRI